MGNNDWRTDNWGGHRDIGRDPNNYHFARDLRRHGHSPYGRYSRDDYNTDTQISVWTLLWVIVAIFFLSATIEWVRNIMEHGGSVIEMWWAGWDDMARTFADYYAK